MSSTLHETDTAEAKEKRRKSLLRRLGPGLVTGASDDDPGGIATYSQAGAGFGFNLLWTSLFAIPLMAAIQEICARIGRVSGHGIAGNLRRHYSKWLLYPVVFLLVLANTINVGADIGAMGDAAALVLGGPALAYAAAFAVLCLVLQVFIHYETYSSYLKWLTVVLFSYIATAFMMHVPWGHALEKTVVPSLQWSGEYWAMFIAILGTTISPYMFFWQAAQETEEIHSKAEEEPLKKKPWQARFQFLRIRFDTYVGMTLSEVVAFFIILSAATTLHAHGITEIDTSAQAAKALEPLAGKAASVLFALGIVGTGLLAVPVLTGSAAYAVGEALHLPTGLSRNPLDAKGFYGVMAVATLLGLALNFPAVERFTHVTPMKALVYSAIINGVVAVPIMAVLMRMARNPKVMGKFVVTSKALRFFGWLATVIMGAATVGMFATWGK